MNRKRASTGKACMPLFCAGVRPSVSDFGGLGVACWPLVPKFAGSNPAEAVGFLGAKKILSTPSFGREVKPWVPCRRFTACKISLNVPWKSGILGKIVGHVSRPRSSSTFRCQGVSRVTRTRRRTGGKSGNV